MRPLVVALAMLSLVGCMNVDEPPASQEGTGGSRPHGTGGASGTGGAPIVCDAGALQSNYDVYAAMATHLQDLRDQRTVAYRAALDRAETDCGCNSPNWTCTAAIPCPTSPVPTTPAIKASADPAVVALDTQIATDTATYNAFGAVHVPEWQACGFRPG